MSGRRERSSRALPTGVVVLLQAVLVVALVTGAGAVSGLVWEHLWDPPTGVVQSERWFTGESGLRSQFSATGLYVVVALAAGLVCGVVCAALLARWELVSLLVLLATAVGAGLLMRHVGVALGPADPDRLARGAADGTMLPGALALDGRPPLVALPLGAVLGFAVLLISVGKRGSGAPREESWQGPGPMDQASSGSTFSPRPPG